ncbi:hypothetical protein CBL_10794 [Carabus blaptoides fortunei]
MKVHVITHRRARPQSPHPPAQHTVRQETQTLRRTANPAATHAPATHAGMRKTTHTHTIFLSYDINTVNLKLHKKPYRNSEMTPHIGQSSDETNLGLRKMLLLVVVLPFLKHQFLTRNRQGGSWRRIVPTENLPNSHQPRAAHAVQTVRGNTIIPKSDRTRNNYVAADTVDSSTQLYQLFLAPTKGCRTSWSGDTTHGQLKHRASRREARATRQWTTTTLTTRNRLYRDGMEAEYYPVFQWGSIKRTTCFITRENPYVEHLLSQCQHICPGNLDQKLPKVTTTKSTKINDESDKMMCIGDNYTAEKIKPNQVWFVKLALDGSSGRFLRGLPK